MRATLWGPDAPIINRYQESLEASGWRVTRMEALPNEFCWVALQVIANTPDDFEIKYDDEVGAFIRGIDLGLVEVLSGWDDDPLEI